MKIKKILYVSVLLMLPMLATAQIPCSPTITPPATLSVNWPQYHFDIAHTGCNPYESILSRSTVGNLVLDWKYTTGGKVESAPTVVNGIVYVGSGDNNLYALNANTGALIWKYDTGLGIAYSPTVANGMIYVHLYIPASLVALNANTGAPIWSQPFDEMSTPVVSNGVLYIASGRNVYALNAVTGEWIWESVDVGVVESSPAVANGVVYIGSLDDHLYALNAHNGTVLWAYETGDSIEPSPTVANGVVYVSAQDYRVYAVDAKDGTLLWETGYGPVSCKLTTCGVAVADGVAYVEAAFPNYTTFALDGRTGEPLWGQWNIGGSTGPAVANGVVYLGSDDNNVYALSAATGEVLWNYATGDYVAGSPAVANGKLYVGSNDGNIYAFHLPGK